MTKASLDKFNAAGRLTETSTVGPDPVALPAVVPASASEATFRTLMDALPAAIYTTDAVGHFTYCNPAAVVLFGYSPALDPDQAYGNGPLYYPDGTPWSHAPSTLASAWQAGLLVHGLETILKRPDGTQLWCEAYPTLLHDSTGQVMGVLNMLVNITERKRAEAASA